MEIISGDNGMIEVEVGSAWYEVACFESFAYTFSNEIIGKTDVNAGLSRKKRVRISDSSLSVSGAMTIMSSASSLSTFYFLQEGIRRSELTLRLSYLDQGGNLKMITSNFLIESIELTNAIGEIDGYDIEFTGTGEPTISDTESPSESPACFEATSDWWLPANGTTSFSGAGHLGRSFAGKTLVEVIRENGAPLKFTSGTPGDGEYSFNGTTIGVWTSNPFNGSESVFVMWNE